MNFAPAAFTDLPPEERKKKGTICGAVCCVLILAIIGGVVGGIYAKKESLANEICSRIALDSVAQAPAEFPAGTTQVDIKLIGNLKVSVNDGAAADTITITDFAKKGTKPTPNNIVAVSGKTVTSANLVGSTVEQGKALFSCLRSDAELKLKNGNIEAAKVTVDVTGGYDIDIEGDLKVTSLAINTNGAVTLADKYQIKTISKDATGALKITSKNAKPYDDIEINGLLSADGGVIVIETKSVTDTNAAVNSIRLNGPVVASELKVYGTTIVVNNNSTLTATSVVPKASFTVGNGGSLNFKVPGFGAAGMTSDITLGSSSKLALSVGACAATQHDIKFTYLSQECPPVKDKSNVEVSPKKTIPIWFNCPFFDVKDNANVLVAEKVSDKFGPYKSFKAEFDAAILAAGGSTSVAKVITIILCPGTGTASTYNIALDVSLLAKSSATWNSITLAN